MSATEGSSGSNGRSGGRAPSDPRPAGGQRLVTRPLYEPTWWQRRFPWLLDALAALDPAPLGRRLSAVLAPARAVVETLSRPLAAVLDLVARGIGASWRGLHRALGAAIAALPLPGSVRRSLWLPLRTGEAHP